MSQSGLVRIVSYVLGGRVGVGKSSVLASVGFTLPLPPPRDPGFSVIEVLGRVATIWGVLGLSGWSLLVPTWPLKVHPWDPTSPYLDPKSSKHGPTYLTSTPSASQIAT